MTRLDVLIEEYKLTTAKIESFLQSQHKYINSTLLLVAAFFVFAYDPNDQNKLEYLYILPFVVLCILGVFVYHFKRTLALQSYKRYLEDQINQKLNSKTVIYGEVALNYMLKKDLFSIFNFFAYVIIYFGLIYLADMKTSEDMKIYTRLYLIVGIIFLAICVPIVSFAKKMDVRFRAVGGKRA